MTTKKQFDDYLITILYPLTEKLGDSSSIVSQSAWATLQLISENCNCESVADLVAKNTDYLIDTIIHHLRHLRFHFTFSHYINVIVEIIQIHLKS
jgi:hypothetical protein